MVFHAIIKSSIKLNLRYSFYLVQRDNNIYLLFGDNIIFRETYFYL